MSDNIYRKKSIPVRIERFTPEMADKVFSSDGTKLYYIQTHEGMRLIDESMYVAEKPNNYRHPMSPEVFREDYYHCPNGQTAASQMSSRIRRTADQLTAISDEIKDSGIDRDVLVELLRMKADLLREVAAVGENSEK